MPLIRPRRVAIKPKFFFPMGCVYERSASQPILARPDFSSITLLFANSPTGIAGPRDSDRVPFFCERQLRTERQAMIRRDKDFFISGVFTLKILTLIE